jgi:hypothetical protein
VFNMGYRSRHYRVGGLVQVVECLLSQHEVLSQTPVLSEKKKKQAIQRAGEKRH